MKYDINDIDSLIEWDKNKIVAQTILNDNKFLSTVCIPPINNIEWYETMLFDNHNDMNELGCWRWDSREAATQGHQDILEELRHEQLTIELSGLGVINEQND